MLLSSNSGSPRGFRTCRRSACEIPSSSRILAAGTLSEAQVEAIRGFQRRKGLTFRTALRSPLAWCRAKALSSRFRSTTTTLFLASAAPTLEISRELVVGYQPFSAAAEAYRTVRSALVTGSLSQGKNAFAVIGARSSVG